MSLYRLTTTNQSRDLAVSADWTLSAVACLRTAALNTADALTWR